MFGNHDKELAEAIEKLAHAINRLANKIAPGQNLPTALQIFQIGENMITGVPVGGSGTFVEVPQPVGSALPAGQTLSVTWTVDDPNVSLAPSTDGTQVVATVAATDTATSFNLTATGTAPALSTPIKGTVNVPIIPTAPPLPTSLAINQTA